LRIIDHIHDEKIGLSIRAFRTSPMPSILYIAGESLLQIRRSNEILKYVAKKELEHHMAYQIFTSSHNSGTSTKQKKKSWIHTLNFVMIQTALSPLRPFLYLQQLTSDKGPLKSIRNSFPSKRIAPLTQLSWRISMTYYSPNSMILTIYTLMLLKLATEKDLLTAHVILQIPSNSFQAIKEALVYAKATTANK